MWQLHVIEDIYFWQISLVNLTRDTYMVIYINVKRIL